MLRNISGILLAKQPGTPVICFAQGTCVPNMNLKYSYKAELLHDLLVAMVTRFPRQQVYPLLHINRILLPNMNLRFFHVVKLLQNSFVAIVTMFP